MGDVLTYRNQWSREEALSIKHELLSFFLYYYFLMSLRDGFVGINEGHSTHNRVFQSFLQQGGRLVFGRDWKAARGVEKL